jgi:hypothetical protein
MCRSILTLDYDDSTWNHEWWTIIYIYIYIHTHTQHVIQISSEVTEMGHSNEQDITLKECVNCMEFVETDENMILSDCVYIIKTLCMTEVVGCLKLIRYSELYTHFRPCKCFHFNRHSFTRNFMEQTQSWRPVVAQLVKRSLPFMESDSLS